MIMSYTWIDKGQKDIAGLVVWSLASGAQGPRINAWSGHSRLGRD